MVILMTEMDIHSNLELVKTGIIFRYTAGNGHSVN